VSTAGPLAGVKVGRDGQAGRQGCQFQGVAVGYRRRDGWGAGLAVADQVGRQAVQEPSEQAAAAEPGPGSQPAQHLRLDGQADGQTRPLDVLGGPAAAVDLEQVDSRVTQKQGIDTFIKPPNGGLIVLDVGQKMTVLDEDFDFRGRWDIALGDPAVEFGKVCNALGL
jgi:hypothetical protein